MKLIVGGGGWSWAEVAEISVIFLFCRRLMNIHQWLILYSLAVNIFINP